MKILEDGAGGGLRGCGDVLVAANTCTAVELRRAAALDELRNQDGTHCAPGSLDMCFFAEPSLRENEEYSEMRPPRAGTLVGDELDNHLAQGGAFCSDLLI